MIEIDKLLDKAILEGASDIHLISDLKPMLRIRRDLVAAEEFNELTPEDMIDLYDYFVRGNVEKDEIYRNTRKLDASAEYKEIRLRVNISMANDIPIFTLRLIKNTLPRFEDLGVPEIVRRMTREKQGLLLVTRKNKLW